LKLKHDEPLSIFAFNLNLCRNLCRYTAVYASPALYVASVQPPVHLGEAVQVEPMKLTLKVPGTERLKLEYDKVLSNFAFKFKFPPLHLGAPVAVAMFLCGALSIWVRRCRLIL